MNLRGTISVLGAALVLAACSSGAEVTTAAQPVAVQSLASVAASVAAAPKCVDVFRAGAKVVVKGTQVDCLDPDGTLVITPVQRCADGTHLGSIEATSGAPRGYFVAPGPFVVVKGELAADKGYGSAYTKCMG